VPKPLLPAATRTVVLPDVNFEFDSAVLRDTTFAALDSIAAEFRSRQSLRAEFNGYTDSTGTAKHNLKLSGNRAKSVRDDLIARGVKPDVLSANGYGAADPVAYLAGHIDASRHQLINVLGFPLT
jgi:OOP family OmpA-OmpF porin